MTPVEERLRRALSEEAEARDVDPQHLLAATREQLAATRRAGRPRPHRAVTLTVAAAAVLVVVWVTGVTTLRSWIAPDVTSDGAGVAADFSCPEQVDVDLSGSQDEFLPDLTRQSPAQVAQEHQAPRWRFAEDGDTARLYLGNDDGTLGSVTTYARSGGEWEMVSARACGNGSPATPTSDALRLGRHGSAPHDPRGGLSVGDRDLEPVLVDDRAVYDYSGLVTRHRSMYVAPCDERACWASGQPDSVITTSTPLSPEAGERGLRDLSGIFFVPDDMVGREQPFRFLVVPDQPGATSFTVSAADRTYAGVRLSDPSWGGRALWAVLVPSSERSWTVELRAGDEVLVGSDDSLDAG